MMVKPTVTSQDFDFIKKLVSAGAKTRVIRSVTHRAFTTIKMIGESDTYEDYKALTKAVSLAKKLKKVVPMQDVPVVAPVVVTPPSEVTTISLLGEILKELQYISTHVYKG